MRFTFPILVFCAYNMVQPAKADPAPALPHTLVTLDSSVIRVADLFSNAGPQASRVLGASPAPGMRIVVGSDQLAAIAAAYQVPWQPDGTQPQVVLASPGRALATGPLDAAIASAVASSGGPPDAAITLPDFSPPMIPPDEAPSITVTGMNFDPTTGNFNASLIVSAASMAPLSFELSGLAQASVPAVVATQTLPPGTLLTAADVTIARLPQNLAQNALVSPAAAIGMTTTLGIQAGAAIAANGLATPIVVPKGGSVVLSLSIPGLNVTAQGIALGAGGTGSVIPVLNAASHAVVQAVITGPGAADIAPGSTPLSNPANIGYNARYSGGYAHYASYAQAHMADYQPYTAQP